MLPDPVKVYMLYDPSVVVLGEPVVADAVAVVLRITVPEPQEPPITQPRTEL